MSGRLEVICGTAGSGKTARLLDLFRREQAQLLARCTPGQAVWITPTVRSRRELFRRLLNESLRAFWLRTFLPSIRLPSDCCERRAVRSARPSRVGCWDGA